MSSESSKLEELLTRGVEEIFVRESMIKKLSSGKPLRVKFGIDPTGPKIHIGRETILRKLKAFQDLGHTIVLVVGDFTALVGDPSDKLDKRPMLTKEKIEENLKTYKEQLGKIIDLSKAELHYNSKWLSELTFDEICRLAESFSVQQMLSRRNFKGRLESKNEISLREFMYPLMQGYDSVKVKADIEIGGFDQLFNLMAGRTVQKHYGMEEQDILTCVMLEGTDGRKMSTSWGNIIAVSDEPSDMFGKVMSLRDDLILKYFILATNVSLQEIEGYKRELERGENPKNIKMKLAAAIVSEHHGKEKAEKAVADFEETFTKGGIPDDLQEVKYEKGSELIDIFLKENVVASKTEFRRLLAEGAIKRIEGKKETVLEDKDGILKESAVYKIGKRRFLSVLATD